MNIRERNLTVGLWLLGLWATVATVACLGLSRNLSRLQASYETLGTAYEALACSIPGGCR